MQNDASTSITKEGVLKIIELSGHEAEVLDFTSLEIPEAKTAAPKGQAKGGASKEENKKEEDEPD